MSATRPVAARLWHYIARHGESRVSKAAIISAVPPLMVQTRANPKGLPKKVFDDFQVALAANRSQFYRDVAAGPFYNYNKTGKPSEATIENWWRQGMMGGAKAITMASLPSHKPISPRT
jgi:non-heme chloroperoxidase